MILLLLPDLDWYAFIINRMICIALDAAGYAGLPDDSDVDTRIDCHYRDGRREQRRGGEYHGKNRGFVPREMMTDFLRRYYHERVLDRENMRGAPKALPPVSRKRTVLGRRSATAVTNGTRACEPGKRGQVRNGTGIPPCRQSSLTGSPLPRSPVALPCCTRARPCSTASRVMPICVRATATASLPCAMPTVNALPGDYHQ